MPTAVRTPAIGDAVALFQAVERIHEHLARFLAEGVTTQPPHSPPASEADVAAPALETIAESFGLSPFELDLLVLCAGAELDPRIRSQCAAIHGDARYAHPTFMVALAALPNAHWSAIAPTSPLRHWMVLDLAGGDGIALAPLRIDERVLQFLLGAPSADRRLACLSSPIASPRELAPSQIGLATGIVETLASSGRPALIQLSGGDSACRRTIAAAAARALGLSLNYMDASDIPSTPGERDLLARLCEREALLTNAAFLIHADAISPNLLTFLDALGGVVIVDGADPVSSRTRAVHRVEASPMTPEEQRRLWHASLGDHALALNGQLDEVTEHFQLDADAIRETATTVARRVASGEQIGAALWDACRAEARPRLRDLAQRIEPRATWDAMVLPRQTLQTLRTIVAHVRQRARVHREWGFADETDRGLAVTALFTGPSGTGKTMAAEVLARELKLDLYRVDLSALVSKYIGETEKNLRRVFDAAELGGAILLFDEADALFGRRSEVKDSHDRYANVEISYLLQRMESYRGLAILTTNMRGAIDTAFLRRIRFIVQFPFPDESQRAEIWRRIYPASAPTAGLEAKKLARLTLAGGSIRNVALNAAFLAAESDEPIQMRHLLAAAAGEYIKLERTLTESETEDWI